MKPGPSPKIRNLFIFAAIVLAVFWAMYPSIQARVETSQAALVDIREIEILRTRFNHDVGQIRLVILLNPT